MHLHYRCLIGSIVLIMVADIFSEKLMLCCLLNLAATGLGFFSMFLWIGFFEKLALATDSRLKMGCAPHLPPPPPPTPHYVWSLMVTPLLGV
jgi:hypothetical protein